MAKPMSDDDLYDNYDQDPNEGSEESSDKEDSSYESFLAPKASFPSGLEVGSTHKVKVERILDDEVQMVCTGKDKKEESESEKDEFYE